MKDFRDIAKVVDAHGLKGELLIHPFDPDARWLEKGFVLQIVTLKETIPGTIRSFRRKVGKAVIALQGIQSRAEAEALKGALLRASVNDLPEPEEDEFYLDELIGLTVKSQDSDKVLGTVQDVVSAPAGDYLEIAHPALSQPALIPFLNVFIPRVDRTERVLYITGLDTLFEDI